MLNINITNDTFNIRNINKESISNIYSIYKNTYDYSYATGIFNTIDYKQFSHQISQFITRQNVFFLDIYLVPSREVIGFIKGIIIKNEKIIWINSLAINKPYQRKGHGVQVMNLLENFLMQQFGMEKSYISVYKKNITGIRFWKKCGYKECNQLSELCSDSSSKLVTFMYKDIRNQ
ncbi:GNAT family N-acetyltransferase [Ruminiclostridium herbifermentans]|uniref:GNAT family N-acetyltransferase n=1 Tax=Ruminiclostridium herbifermentans TaxID=2488810 RepID=A0A4U7J9H7_9FIRM|nr:GNAT family N-acetyltransferase [Ruminiclostridium herbifermentans]QNU65581.1 GNAT family N-acetyltransferase [Ruminiclostridium herbifermentans]